MFHQAVLAAAAPMILISLVSACSGPAGSAADGGTVPASTVPHYARLSDVPARPQGLPTAAELAERRRRLEEDRAAATGSGPPPQPSATQAPEPLPELTEALREELPPRPATDRLQVGRPGVSVQMATVNFPDISGELDAQAVEALRQVAREQQSIGGGIRIVGHRGDLSEAQTRRQIAAIGQTLLRLGVPPTRIDSDLAADAAERADGDHGHAVIYLDY